jgi:hypothetical protein
VGKGYQENCFKFFSLFNEFAPSTTRQMKKIRYLSDMERLWYQNPLCPKLPAAGIVAGEAWSNFQHRQNTFLQNVQDTSGKLAETGKGTLTSI